MTYDLENDLFMGFDLSTQQLKILITNSKLKHLKSYSIEFDTLFASKYGVRKGVIVNEDEIVAPVAMYLESIDALLEIMKKDNFPFHKVSGMSGSCQQHGSIYWSKSSSDSLATLSPVKSLVEQLSNAFTFPMCPNWQDHSTGKELNDFENTIGVERLSQISGSRGHYRFTGLQIRKKAKQFPNQYKETDRISLVSSFVPSLFLGEITGIEQGDACGMNLYDLSTNDYDDELLSLAAGVHPAKDGISEEQSSKGIKELREKLGPIDPITHKAIGNVSNYFVTKYGFNPQCKVYSFTGDNLATILSLPLQKNDLLVSLGTSTTILLITESFNPSPQYHVFKHPTIAKSYMGMICFSNGSLARENINHVLNEKYGTTQWDKFNQILKENIKQKTLFGGGELGVYFPVGEIVPNVKAQTRRYTQKDGKITETSWVIEKDVVSIIESQSISCRLRSGPMLNSPYAVTEEGSAALKKLNTKYGELLTDGKPQTVDSLTSRPNRCFFVGGASNNPYIISKMASILGATQGNYKADIPNACALGGAYKASWSHYCENVKVVDYSDYLGTFFEGELNKFEAVDAWDSYYDGCGFLAKIEQTLN